MAPKIETHGLTELIGRMQQYPDVLKRKIAVAMNAILLVLWENVPPYPDAPELSTYERTGTLGRTLGSDLGGGKGSDTPSIYKVEDANGGYEAHFGTDLEYAHWVIGDEDQAWMHQGRWWIMKTVLALATDKINKIFDSLTDVLAKFLETGIQSDPGE